MRVVPFAFTKKDGLRSRLDSGEEMDPRPRNISSEQVKNIQKALLEFNEDLGKWWTKGDREPVAATEG